MDMVNQPLEGANMAISGSRIWIIVAVAVMVVGGAGFWFWREAGIREEIARAAAKAEAAKLTSGEELTAAIAALAAVRTKYAGRPADDLRDADSAARILAERQRELTDRKADFDGLLSTAERLMLTDPAKALRKLAQAEELGKEDRTRGYRGLLSVSPALDERRESAEACLALQKALTDAPSAIEEGDWVRVRDQLSAALKGQLPPGARSGEVEELLSKAKSRIGEFGNRLSEGEKCLALSKFVEAKAAFEEAKALWPKSPDIEKATKGIEAARLGEERRLEEVRKADLRQALTTALQPAVEARDRGDWESVSLLLRKPLSDWGNVEHPRREVARSSLEQAEAELKKRGDYQDKLREGKNLLSGQRYVEARNAFEAAKRIWPDAPTVSVADEGIRQANSKSNDLRYEAEMLQARWALREERWTEAEERLTKALKEKPQDPEASQALEQARRQLSDRRYAAAISQGQEFYQQKNWSEARAAYQKALSERNGDMAALVALAAIDQMEKDATLGQLLAQGQALRQQGKLAEAREVYRQALKADNSCKAAADALAAIDLEGEQAASKVQVEGQNISLTSISYPFLVNNTFLPCLAHLCGGVAGALVKVSVRNDGRGTATLVFRGRLQGYSNWYKETIILAAGAAQTVCISPGFKEELSLLAEQRPGAIEWEVNDNAGHVLHSKTQNVALASRNDIQLTKVHSPLVAVFVTPSDPILDEVVSATGMPMTGYQGKVLDQVEAVYRVLADLGLHYRSATTSFLDNVGTPSQRVYFARESVGGTGANCIDGTVLFASCLEKIGLRPAIVLIRGHAFLAVAAAEKGSQWIFVETTMLGEGKTSFAAAVTEGGRKFEENKSKGLELIQISECRRNGILPYPYYELLAKPQKTIAERLRTARVESWPDRAIAVIQPWSEGEMAANISVRILKCTHPTGASPGLSGLQAQKQGSSVSATLEVAWQGGLLKTPYTTTVNWTFSEGGHERASVTQDNAPFPVSPEKAKELDAYFHDKLYPLVVKGLAER